MSKTFSIILGSILALIGLLGFVSNPLIGSNAIFVTNAAYNITHLIFGAVLLIVAFWFNRNSGLWLKVIGVLMFLLGIVGIVYSGTASNWMHIIAGIVIFIAGVYGKSGGGTIIAQKQ